MVIKQLLRAVYKGNINHFTEMRELSLHLRKQMVDQFGETYTSLRPVATQESKQAHKVLYECSDSQRIESVALSFRNHESLCISSQVGCAFACQFCETGKVGLKRQLTVSEITDQVYHARVSKKVDSISFMGMGECLANPKSFDAIAALTSQEQFGLSASRINVSTIGIIPGLRKLNEVHPNVNVTYSLHSPFPDQRKQLMPIEKAYPFMHVFEVLDERIRKTKNRVWIAYLLLQGVNDSKDHARALTELIKRRSPEVRYLYHINLLPYNPGRTPQSLRRVDDITNFRRIIEAAGIANSYRNSFGSAIDAACGQLYGEYEARRLDPLNPVTVKP